MNYKALACSFIISVFICFFIVTAKADTVFLKNAEQIKGIVVENYYDRIVLSTVDGEKNISKQDIEDILYDRMEQNLVKLGDFHQGKGNLMRAYTYYSKACNLNPDYKEAQDKFIHIRSALLRRPEKQLMDDMDRRRALFKESGKIYDPATTENPSEPSNKKFKDLTGLVLISESEMPKVEHVASASQAAKAGIEKGDFIFMVWGKLTAYYELDTIIDMIMDSPSPEIILSIKRSIIIPREDNKKYGGFSSLGFSLEMREGGLTVSGVKPSTMAKDKGMSEGDLIVAINGNPTRYMPLKDAVELIDKYFSKIGIIELDVIRDITLWRVNKDGYQ